MILEEAIQQKTFADGQHRLLVNLYYTQAQLHHASNQILKPYDISLQQFNILRILRGQKGKPLSISQITDRMFDPMSNAYRLVEILRKKDLVARYECVKDRRRAEISLTPHGAKTIEQATQDMDRFTHLKLNALKESEVSLINDLLDRINTNSLITNH